LAEDEMACFKFLKYSRFEKSGTFFILELNTSSIHLQVQNIHVSESFVCEDVINFLIPKIT
jgi:hypothetical protein